MSSGAVFKLLANDGKPDRLTLASGLLHQRMRDVACTRARAGRDPTPTLLDIEKTHILHVNAHFKPMAALAFEYNKVSASSGSTQFGSDVQFSIPQFGDFFHDMVIHTRLSHTFTQGGDVPDEGDTTTHRGAKSILPAANRFWDNVLVDPANANQTIGYTLVDAFGNAINDAEPYRNMVRYIEFPAERMFQDTKFNVNGNPLDDYTWRTVIMMRKFTILDEKLVGYKKLVGQEVPFEGYSAPRACALLDKDHISATLPAVNEAHGPAGPNHGSVQNVGVTPDAYMTLPRHSGGDFTSNQWSAQLDQMGTPLNTAATGITPGVDDAGDIKYQHVQRAFVQAVDGLQTPKYYQPATEFWNRLWFWFCLDARLAAPSVAIPFGQRFITCSVSPADAIVVDFPGLFVRQQITTVAAPNQIHTVNFRPYWANLAIQYPTISDIKLYINNIFVNPEVHDIFIRRVGFSLIRVFRQQVTVVNTSNGNLLLSQLKWPIEYMFVGFQPEFNTANVSSNSITKNNPNYAQDWHRLGKTFDSVCNLRQQAIHNATGLSNIGQVIPDTYIVERPVVSEIGLKAHGVSILDNMPRAFLSTYQPFHFGGDAIRPPSDPGAMMINFALFPGCYQVSGYLNISRARETYIEWVSSYIGSATTATCIVTAVAINFLLVTDGSAVLRFST